MTDLHQVIDLNAAADAGFAYAGSVDAGVGLNFHVVFDYDWSWLRNLVPLSVVSLGEAKSVGTDDDSVVQQDVVADAAVLADHNVSVREEVAADLYAAIDYRVREQHCMIADLDVLVDDHIRTDVSVASNLRAGMDDCCRMNSRSVTQRLVEEFEGAREALIGILDAQRGCWDCGKSFGDYYGCGLGLPRCRRVFLIGDEGDL